ncbi:hypothetical protein [Spirosoma litoris]
MKKTLLVLSLLFSFLGAVAQNAPVSYRVSTLNNAQIVIAQYADGSRKQVSSLPTDAVVGRKGGIVRLPYAPEGKAQFNPEQFGTGKYYSPTFGFAMDFNPGAKTPAQLRARGQNRFTQWTVSSDEKAALPFGDGVLYLTESSFNYEYEGALYYESTLSAYEAKLWATFPTLGTGVNTGFKYLVFNIETSNGWGRGNYTGASSFWPSWESVKTHSIKCEFDGVDRTLEQIDNANLWDVETAVRRANRLLIAFKVARAKAALAGVTNLKISYGASPYQGLPRKDFQPTTHGIFQPGSANVNNIGGSNNTIVLNGRTYSGMTGDQWGQEDFTTGYYYLFNFDIARSDYNDIWVNKLAGTQNYPYLWSKIKLRHIVADEKGYLQKNREWQQLKQGTKRGILRMQEPVYEADAAGIVDGTFPAEIHRLPFAEVQPSVTGQSEAPKIQQPPYLNYSRYCVTRFFAGNEENWGFYVFPTDISTVRGNISALPQYNYHQHALTAIYQARADMQPYEQFYTGSTLVEDPEVQLNGAGNFSAYDGTDAYNYSDGVQGQQKPAYMLRYKATSTGWRVLILGGMNQDWTAERTDIIRVPGGGLNGNLFKVKLRGPAAQIYEFAVKNTDSGQTYEALPQGNTAWERAGYAGRVGTVTTSPPSSTTTSPGSTTQIITIAAYSQTINGPENRFIYTVASGTTPTSTDLSFTGVPGTASDYNYSLIYQTNEGSGTGTGAIKVNGGSVQSTFTTVIASGGTRTVTGTLSLTEGNNTITFTNQSGSFPYQVRSLSITRAASTTTIVTSGTTTTGGSSSAISYSRVFVIGNSITTNWVTSDNTRGLDASTPEKDYFHILTNYLKTLNPNVEVRQFASWSNIGPDCGGLKLDASDGPYWEQHYASLPGNAAYCGFTGSDSLDRYNLVADWKPDLIVSRIGENVLTVSNNFEYHYKRLIDKLKNKNQSATVVLSTSVWQEIGGVQVDVSNIITSVGAQRGYPVADLSGIAGSRSGASSHPNDPAMQEIANRIWAAIPKSTTVTPPITATGLAALGLNPNFVAPADQGWNITTTREKYIESSALKIGFLRGGAVISYGALKRDNRNLVNSNQVYYNDNPADFRYNTFTDDLGRQIMFFSDYMSPNPNDNSGQGLIFKNGKKTSTGYKGYVFNTGANPVQGGSLFPALDFSPILSSAVYTHPQRGTEFYAKMRPQIWGVNAEPGWIVGEQWCYFPLPNVLAFFTRRTVEVRDPTRFTEQRTYGSISQENPCIYLIAPLIQKLINVPGESRKNIYNGIGTTQNYFTNDCRIGAYEGEGGTGVTYYSPMQSQVGSMQIVGTTGNWGDNASSYIQGAPRRNYDNPGIYEDYGYLIFGTEAEANAAIAQLPGIDQSFDFDFTKENMLWYNEGSPLIKESAGWTMYLNPQTDNGVTSYSAKLSSPARAWQASGVTTINFDIAVTNATSLKLVWQKPGLNYDNQFSKTFTVPNPDGQFHTISVSTSDPNFNGIISSIGFGSTSTTQPNAKVVIRRIWKN